MEIKCDKCSKIFIVDQNLIPHNGRLVQCSNCKNEWFFKPNDKKTEELSQDFNYDNDKIKIYNEELETLDFISNNSKDQVSSSVKYDSSIITKEKKKKNIPISEVSFSKHYIIYCININYRHI